MRLIAVENIELRFFNEDDVPPYAILSHTWGPDEVSYQELLWITKVRGMSQMFASQNSEVTIDGYQDNPSALMLAAMEIMVRGNFNLSSGLPDTSEEALLKRRGYAKIVNSAKEARKLGLQYIWIDTCCIDKTSSSELQEAINSMYRYYKNSTVCLVYLSDVPPSIPDSDSSQAQTEDVTDAFNACRWITRGWTLQELVAPSSVRFYRQDWSLMGDKTEFLGELAKVTGIPIFILENGDPSEMSLAERMSWACNRETTRTEDVAYCLLGLFDIQMPLLYGEGAKAFIRLQEEILKTTDDYSLFAWRAVTAEKFTYRGLLAQSPMEFRDCGSIECESSSSKFPVHSTPIGIRLQLEFLPDSEEKSRIVAMVRSTNYMNQRIGIYLKCLDGDMQYARVDAGTLVLFDNWPTGKTKTIYVRQKLVIPHDFTAPEMHCVHIQRRVADRTKPSVRITDVYPSEYWDPKTHRLVIPNAEIEYFGVVALRGQSSPNGCSANFQIIIGFNRETQHYWCKAVEHNWPKWKATWRTIARRIVPPRVYEPSARDDVRHDIFIIGNSGLAINISTRAGLCGDNIALQLLIDGLIKTS